MSIVPFPYCAHPIHDPFAGRATFLISDIQKTGHTTQAGYCLIASYSSTSGVRLLR